jgi:hypothetical protein
VVVGRFHADLSAGDELVDLVRAAGPPLRHDRRSHGPAKRVAHLLPGDGRTAVKDRPVVHARHDLDGGFDADELRRPLVQPARHLGVGFVDFFGVPAVEPSQRGDQLGVAIGGNSPIDLDDGTVLLTHCVAEQRQPEVYDLDL